MSAAVNTLTKLIEQKDAEREKERAQEQERENDRHAERVAENDRQKVREMERECLLQELKEARTREKDRESAYKAEKDRFQRDLEALRQQESNTRSSRAAEREAFKVEIHESQGTLSRLREEIKGLRAQLQAAEGDLQASRDMCDTLSSERSELMGSLEMTKSELKTSSVLCDTITAERDALRKSLEGAKSELKASGKLCDTIGAERDELRKLLDKAASERDGALLQAQALKMHLDKPQPEEEIEKVNQTLQSVQDKILRLAEENQRLNKQLESSLQLAHELESARLELENTKQELRSAREDLVRARSDVQRCAEERAALQQKVDQHVKMMQQTTERGTPSGGEATASTARNGDDVGGAMHLDSRHMNGVHGAGYGSAEASQASPHNPVLENGHTCQGDEGAERACGPSQDAAAPAGRKASPSLGAMQNAADPLVKDECDRILREKEAELARCRELNERLQREKRAGEKEFQRQRKEWDGQMLAYLQEEEDRENARSRERQQAHQRDVLRLQEREQLRAMAVNLRDELEYLARQMTYVSREFRGHVCVFVCM